MTFLKKHWQLTLFVIAVLSISGYLFYQSQQKPDLQITGTDVKTPDPATEKVPVGDTSQGGHWHGDEWHAEPHEPQTTQSTINGQSKSTVSPKPTKSLTDGSSQDKPLLVAGETTSADTTPTSEKQTETKDTNDTEIIANPSTGHSHSRNPFPLPDYIRNNPHLFEVLPDGYYTAIVPDDKRKRIEQVQGKDGWLNDRAQILAEGLDNLTAAAYLSSKGRAKKEAFEYLDKARAVNPNDFETLLLWARWHIDRKPTEAETIYRRLIQMQPESDRAQFYFGYHILETHPEPKEAISAFKKAYELNPNADIALLRLGNTYEKLGQYEQALKYYQASWDRSSSQSASFGISYVKSKLAEQEATPHGDR